jgi:murein DD-endopeptidase MepM/ murein hydrolase activator NlpD
MTVSLHNISMNNLLDHTLRFCSLLVLSIPLSAQATLPESSSVPGGIAVVPIGSVSTGASKPQTWLGEQPVLVTSDHGQWYAVVGLPLDTAAGSHELKIKVGDGTKMQSFEVVPKKYPEQRIVLKDKSKVELSPADLARAEREIALIKSLKLHWRDAQDTDLDFILPAEGELGGRFGVHRFFNGEPRAPHAGLDVAVKSGSPVKSSAAGVVLAIGDYFFNGKTIFVDHGNGLITMYCHLDQFDVQTGQTVSKGQLLGLSGQTGRATGPHLHWSVILNGAMVDPELLIAARQNRQ